MLLPTVPAGAMRSPRPPHLGHCADSVLRLASPGEANKQQSSSASQTVRMYIGR
jgi:hypothetical protein